MYTKEVSTKERNQHKVQFHVKLGGQKAVQRWPEKNDFRPSKCVNSGTIWALMRDVYENWIGAFNTHGAEGTTVSIKQLIGST